MGVDAAVTISFVQAPSPAVNTAGATSITNAFPSNTAGNLILAACGWQDSAGTTTVSSVADTVGNSYSAATVKRRDNANVYATQVYMAWNIGGTGSTNTVTWTFSASAAFRRFHILEYTSSNGAWSSNPKDQDIYATGTGTSLSSGNITPTENNTLVIGFGEEGAANDMAASGSFTQRSPTTATLATMVEDLVQGTAAAVSATATCSSGGWGMIAVNFKDAVVTTQHATVVLLPVQADVTVHS